MVDQGGSGDDQEELESVVVALLSSAGWPCCPRLLESPADRFSVASWRLLEASCLLRDSLRGWIFCPGKLLAYIVFVGCMSLRLQRRSDSSPILSSELLFVLLS